MNESAWLKKLKTIAGKSVDNNWQQPFMDEEFYYASDLYAIIRIRKNKCSEGIGEFSKPPDKIFTLDWGIFDGLSHSYEIKRLDIISVAQPVYKCIECNGTGEIYYDNGFNLYKWDCSSCNGNGFVQPLIVWRIAENLYCPINRLDFLTRILGDIKCFATDKVDVVPFKFEGGEGFVIPSELSDDEVFDPYEQKRLFIKDNVYGALYVGYIDKNAAEKIARRFLSHEISLTFHEDTAGIGLYNFDPKNDYLFSFSLNDPCCVGGENYIVVSKKTGKVKLMG
jgi:hypothetical protein